MLRAFILKFGSMKDPNSVCTRDDIAMCIWKIDEFGKSDNEVSTYDSKEQFLKILKAGAILPDQQS